MVASLTIATATSAGCGDDRDGSETGSELTVSAAASLTEAFSAYGESLPGDQRFSFAGSDALAAQIRQGAKPDVYAAANTTYPDELAAEGLVEEPVIFTQNQLVMAVPAESGFDSIADLTEPGLDLVACATGVPCGDYTRQVLDRLPVGKREAIIDNLRSEESGVKGVVGKVAQGAADAGFVYESDVAAAANDLRAVKLPAKLEPKVAYGIAVVESTADPEAAQEFIDGLLEGDGAEALAEADFLPPP